VYFIEGTRNSLSSYSMSLHSRVPFRSPGAAIIGYANRSAIFIVIAVLTVQNGDLLVKLIVQGGAGAKYMYTPVFVNPKRLASTVNSHSHRWKMHNRRDASPVKTSPTALSALPSVSVQICTYERLNLMLEAIDQIGAQDYPGDIEVVVVDDTQFSSESYVLEAAKRNSLGVEYISLPVRHTIGEKRNMAAEATAADVICIWDDDDIFPINRISRQVEALYSGKGSGCSSIEIQYLYSADKKNLNVWHKCFAETNEATMCFRRSWFEECDGFDDTCQGEGIGLFRERMHEEQEVARLTAVEMPFLYVRRGDCATGDCVRKGGARRYSPTKLVDTTMLAMARFLYERRFPQLPPRLAAATSDALHRTRMGLFNELRIDYGHLRRSNDAIEAQRFEEALCGRRSSEIVQGPEDPKFPIILERIRQALHAFGRM